MPFSLLSPRLLALAFLVVLATCTTVSAQEFSGEPTARFRFGPVRFTPTISVTNLGVDDNVFNEVDNPKQDTTAAFGPAVELWTHLGKSRIAAKAGAQYLYFDRYESERSWNTVNTMKWEFPAGRVTPFLLGGLSSAKERTGYEIDTRTRVNQTAYGLGTDIRLSGHTHLVLTARRSRLEYDESVYRGVALAEALDRQSDEGQLQVRYRLTPLTTFVVDTRVLADRFLHDPLRNSNSVAVMPGFEFKPFALVAGSAYVGVRRFNPLDDTLAQYTGLVAAVNAGYVFRVSTRIDARVMRDVVYSYNSEEPYYRLNDLGLTVTRRFPRSWELAVRGGRQSLTYTSVTGSTSSRVDSGTQIGAGIGYYIGDTLRLGVDVNRFRRSSPASRQRGFDATKIGASVTYGNPRTGR